MQEIVEIYIKVVVATFGFIAPSMTFLLGIFAKGASRQIKRNEEKMKELESLISLPPAPDTTSNKIKHVEEQLKLMKRQLKKAEKDIRLLNPKRQINRMFIPLILCLLAASVYYGFKSPFINITNVYLKLITLTCSLTLFLYTLFVISQLFNIMIELKQAEYKEEEENKNPIEIEQV